MEVTLDWSSCWGGSGRRRRESGRRVVRVVRRDCREEVVVDVGGHDACVVPVDGAHVGVQDMFEFETWVSGEEEGSLGMMWENGVEGIGIGIGIGIDSGSGGCCCISAVVKCGLGFHVKLNRSNSSTGSELSELNVLAVVVSPEIGTGIDG